MMMHSAKSWLLVVGLAGGVLMLGCDQKPMPEETPTGGEAMDTPQTEGEAEQVGGEVTDEVDAAARIADMDKDQYMEHMQLRLDNAEARLQTMRRQAERIGDEMMAKLGDEMQELESTKQQLKEQLSALQEQSADAWEQTKEGFARAVDSLHDGIDRAMRQLEEPLELPTEP